MILHDELLVPYEKIKWRELVPVICDYCGDRTEKKKNKIQKGRKSIEKDSCTKDPCTKKKLAEINLLKHGVANPFQRKDVKDKIKKTNLERHGVEHAQQSSSIRAKSRATCLRNHGVEHALQNKEILQKAQDKSLELYGTKFPIQLDEFKSKVKDTNLERYGEKDFLKSPEVRERIRQTNIIKYGVESPAASKEVKEKIKKTNVERYGAKNTFASKEIQEKIRDSNYKKYGVEKAASSPQIRKKIVKTNLIKYGFENASCSEEVKNKLKKTNLEKYGFECSLSCPQVRKKATQTNIEKYGTPYPVHKFGKTQESIRSWLNSYDFNFNSDATVLEGKELDLYDIGQKFAIEYCGLYWHNENSPEPRTRSYHYDKWRRCRDKGIQLLTIFDDEWKSKNEIIKSVILSKLGVFERRIHARKCRVDAISKDRMKSFCDIYHIQGGNRLSKVCFGLFHEEELVGVVDLGRHHRKKEKYSVVLTRLCFKAGVQVVGGAGKLFKACTAWCSDNGIKSIVSWSDNRYSDGAIYNKLGFKLIEELPPDYYYVNIKNPKRRLSKQSQSKRNSQCPKEMTELEWANARGLSRIWDCGKARWEYTFVNQVSTPQKPIQQVARPTKPAPQKKDDRDFIS
jgi:hypothetical protein